MNETIKNRRSIRKYNNKPVEDEKIKDIIESARLAPSGDNTQPWHFIVVKSNETKQKLATVSHNQKWMLSAPVFIVCIADALSRFDNNVDIVVNEYSPEQEIKQIIRDTSIGIEHLVLEATRLGLGTCWVAWFTQEDIRPVLNIPSDKYVVSIITLGYTDENPKARPRKSFEEIAHFEKW